MSIFESLSSAGGALFGNRQAKRQERALTNAANQSTALQREMFEKGLQLTAPFREAGMSVLPGLQEAANAPVTPFAFDYNAYFNSPEYAALQQQAEQAVMRNASATGGLRSGGSQVLLSTVAPQIVQQGRQNAMDEYQLNQNADAERFNRLFRLTGLGADVSSNIANMGTNFGVNAGNNAMTIGQARSNRYGNQANLFKGFLTDAGSFATGGFI